MSQIWTSLQKERDNQIKVDQCFSMLSPVKNWRSKEYDIFFNEIMSFEWKVVNIVYTW